MKQKIIIDEVMNGYVLKHYRSNISGEETFVYHDRYQVADHVEEALKDEPEKKHDGSQMEIEIQETSTVRPRVVGVVQQGTVKPIHRNVAQVGVGKKSVRKNINRKGRTGK